MHTMRASDAPNGLAVRIDRFALGDLYLRVWTMWLEGAEPPTEVHDTVLLHGLGVSSQYFENVAVRLARTGRVHLLDLPGFARVPYPRRPPRIEDFATVVERWLLRRAPRDAVLVGHSMGGQVATEVLSRRPAGVRAGVLIGPPTNAEERNGLVQAFRLAQSSMHESSRTRRMALAGYRDTGPSWFVRTLPDLLRYPIEDRVAQVEVPLLVVHGSHDSVCPPPWAQLLAQRAPHGRAVEVPGAAHAVIHDHGAQVAALIREHAQA